MSPDLEKLLRGYIEEERRGERHRQLTSAMETLTGEVRLHARDDERQFARVHQRLDKLEEDVETTGEHEVEELKAHLAKVEKKEEDRVADRRKLLYQIVGGVVVGVLMLGIGVVAGSLAARPAAAHAVPAK